MPILERALKSVHMQTHPADEIIIVYTGTSDDAFTDISKLISKFDNNFKLVRTEQSANGSVGRNLGSELTECEYLAFLDDDDEWYPDKLKSQLLSIKDSHPSIVASPYVIIRQDGTLTVFDHSDCLSNPSMILGENHIGCTSFPLISKRAFNNAGRFDPSLEANQEWDLWIRIILQGGDITFCRETAGIKHESKKSVTNSDKKRLQGWCKIFRKYWIEMIRHPRMGSKSLWIFWKEVAQHGHYICATLGLVASLTLRIWSTIVE